jgi:uncharacterized protein YukE
MKTTSEETLIIKFEKDLYNPEAVRNAAKSFAHLAEIGLSEEAESITAVMTKISSEFSGTLADEFANYTLQLTRELFTNKL